MWNLTPLSTLSFLITKTRCYNSPKRYVGNFCLWRKKKSFGASTSVVNFEILFLIFLYSKYTAASCMKLISSFSKFTAAICSALASFHGLQCLLILTTFDSSQRNTRINWKLPRGRSDSFIWKFKVISKSYLNHFQNNKQNQILI